MKALPTKKRQCCNGVFHFRTCEHPIKSCYEVAQSGGPEDEEEEEEMLHVLASKQTDTYIFQGSVF